MDTFSKTLLKKYAALADAKGRRRAGMFMAEGTKCVCDLSRRFAIEQLYGTPEWLAEHGTLGAAKAEEATKGALKELTNLVAVPPVIAFFRLPDDTAQPDFTEPQRRLVIALDRVQDPGNMGTILRTADWMGVRTVIVSPECVDVFNPKTVQASMGALAQMDVFAMPLAEYFGKIGREVPVYGTYLDGSDVYAERWQRGGVLLMGNEGRGISPALEPFVSRRISIPPGAPDPVAESLNVAVATAMILAIRQSRNG